MAGRGGQRREEEVKGGKRKSKAGRGGKWLDEQGESGALHTIAWLISAACTQPAVGVCVYTYVCAYVCVYVWYVSLYGMYVRDMCLCTQIRFFVDVERVAVDTRDRAMATVCAHTHTLTHT